MFNLDRKFSKIALLCIMLSSPMITGFSSCSSCQKGLAVRKDLKDLHAIFNGFLGRSTELTSKECDGLMLMAKRFSRYSTFLDNVADSKFTHLEFGGSGYLSGNYLPSEGYQEAKQLAAITGSLTIDLIELCDDDPKNIRGASATTLERIEKIARMTHPNLVKPLGVKVLKEGCGMSEAEQAVY